MNAFRTLLIGLVALALAAPAMAQEEKPEKAQREPIYDEAANAREQIAEALASAKSENRRVLIQWGANWCGWCHLLHELCTKNNDLRRKLLFEYDVVLIDIGRWDKNIDLAAKYGADLKANGVPFLTVLDAEGNVLANQETGSLEKETEGKPGHDPEKVMAFLDKHQAPYLPAQSLLADGLAKAKAEDKRVYLHFGAPWCGWCKRLEAWMAKEEVAEILGRHFVDVKIDIDRTIEGAAMLHEMAQSKRTGIPWSAVLDEEGAVAAPGYMGERQNIGYPVADEEIEAFIGMLAKGAPSLTEKEQTMLAESLRKSRPKDR